MPSDKLTPLQEIEARRNAAKSEKPARVISDAEKATRKERVARAKDALARSVGAKGDHVVRARAALKTYLQRLNDPKQPDDARFDELVEAPFKAPPKKTTNDRRF
jgi:precorrin-3B methylase